jgi:hypothetical protein
VKFVYGGGAYKLEDNTIVGPVSLELTGAAANTLALLEQFGMIAKGDPPTTPDPTPTPTPAMVPTPKEKNKPITRTKVVDPPLKGDMSSQYDGTQQ